MILLRVAELALRLSDFAFYVRMNPKYTRQALIKQDSEIIFIRKEFDDFIEEFRP